VSDQELGAEVRQLYWMLSAQESGFEAMLKAKKGGKEDSDMEAQQAFSMATGAGTRSFEDRGEFTDAQQEDWYSKLQA
jgi:hypothetical protein